MTKKALLVGINDYQQVNDLRGCINDVTNLRIMLKELRGFTNEDMRVLIDERATKAAIEERLDWLVSDAAPGDYLLFHYSGHGSRVRMRAADGTLAPELDDIICPYDMDWDGTFILKRDLLAKLRVPQGVRVEVVLDCCNAGSEASDRAALVNAASNSETRARFLAPPPDIAMRHDGDRLLVRSPLMAAEGAARPIVWAACGEKQTAADASFGGVAWGAFTYAVCSLMRQKAGALKRDDLLQLASGVLKDGGFSQLPELQSEPAEHAADAFAVSGGAP